MRITSVYCILLNATFAWVASPPTLAPALAIALTLALALTLIFVLVSRLGIE